MKTFDNVQFADNPPDKRYIVVMLLPSGVARSTHYDAYTEAHATKLAASDNPQATIVNVTRIKKGV
jgi:hypothetical protein